MGLTKGAGGALGSQMKHLLLIRSILPHVTQAKLQLPQLKTMPTPQTTSALPFHSQPLKWHFPQGQWQMARPDFQGQTRPLRSKTWPLLWVLTSKESTKLDSGESTVPPLLC